MILARPKSFQHADNIAVVLSALVKTGYEDAALMERLSADTQELSPSRHALSPASAAKILHSFAVTRTRDLKLIAFISARLQDSVRPAAREGGGGMSRSDGEGRGGAHTAQSVALTVSAVAKLRVRDEALLVAMSAAARALPAHAYNAQSIAMLAHALSTLR